MNPEIYQLVKAYGMMYDMNFSQSLENIVENMAIGMSGVTLDDVEKNTVDQIYDRIIDGEYALYEKEYKMGKKIFIDYSINRYVRGISALKEHTIDRYSWERKNSKNMIDATANNNI